MVQPADLTHIASLIQIVDHGSLSAAARELDVPKSTLSRHLSQLEDALGAPLVVRGHRQLQLTDVGKRLVASARGPLTALGEAARNAAAETTAPRGRVRVSVPSDYGAVVVPLVHELLHTHLDLDVDLWLTDDVVDIRRDGIDLAIRVGVVQDESLIARTLGHIRGLLVASPAFVREHKILAAASDPACLSELPCVTFTSAPFSNKWKLHAKDREPVEVAVAGPFACNSLVAVRGAALAGLGVARLPLYVARDEIAAGRLVVVLPGWAGLSRPVQLVYPPHRHFAPRMRNVIQFFLRCGQELRFDG